MNLNKIFSRQNVDKESVNNNSEETNTSQAEAPKHASLGKVVQFDLSSKNGSSDSNPNPSIAANEVNNYNGLLNSPEMVSFFKHNYFGLGQHNGRKLLSQEALQLAKALLISDFQNNITNLIQQKQNKLNRIKSEIIAIDGLSENTTQRLHVACEHTMIDISELREQLDKSAEGRGWVLDALNRYQIGFMQGMRETLEFKYLLG
jgi:hypothetical protein